MAYTTEAIPTITTNDTQPTMREERVVQHEPKRSYTKPAEQKPLSEPATQTAESVPLSPAAAALARKEQKFRKDQQRLKAETDSLATERAEIAELKALKAKLQAKDYSAVESLVSYDDYTNYLIEKGAAATPEQAEIKKLSGEVDALRTAQQKDVEVRYEAAVAQRREAVTKLTAEGADYASIRGMKAQEHVVQHILDTWETDGIELSVEQAAKEVEEVIREKAQEWAKLVPPAPAAEPVRAKELPPLKPSVKTLTNAMVAGDPTQIRRSFDGMSDSQRYAEARRRALAAIQAKGQ